MESDFSKARRMWSVRSRTEVDDAVVQSAGANSPTLDSRSSAARKRNRPESEIPSEGVAPGANLEDTLSRLDPGEFLRVVRSAAERHSKFHQELVDKRRQLVRTKLRRREEIDEKLQTLAREKSALRQERQKVLQEMNELQEAPIFAQDDARLAAGSLKLIPQLNMIRQCNLDATCSACLEEDSNLLSLPCGHFMHFGCLRRLQSTMLHGTTSISRFNDENPLLAVGDSIRLCRYHRCPMCKRPLDKPRTSGTSSPETPDAVNRSNSSISDAFEFSFPSADRHSFNSVVSTPSPLARPPNSSNAAEENFLRYFDQQTS